MTKIAAIQTSNAPAAIGPYSQAVKITHAQELLYISGQLPIDQQTGLLVTFPAEATKQCMHNISAILTQAEMTLSNIVDVTIFLTDLNDFSAVNSAYESFFTQPYPARATIQVAALPKGACVEIKATAVK